MEDITALQQEYLDQFIKRKSQPIFKQNKQNILGNEEWYLVLHEVVPKELRLKCEFPTENGNLCNRTIHNIYTIRSVSGKLLKVGSTCLGKVVPIKEIKKIEKEAGEIRDALQSMNRKYYPVSKKEFSANEKRELINRAIQEEILSKDITMLLQEGAPLSEGIYTRIETNLFNLEQHHKQEESRGKEQRKMETLYKKVKPASIPSEKEELKKAINQSGLINIQTKGDARKAAELGFSIHVMYPPRRKRDFWRYSESVSEVMAYFDIHVNKRSDFIETMIKRSKEKLKASGYSIFQEKEDDFIFKKIMKEFYK